MKYKLFIFLFIPVISLAQPYSNDWIDYNKEYYKISVAENAIYSIGYDDLNAVGFPVSSIDPRRIQIFHRGIEIAVNIEGELDGVLNPGDYIEFYGQKNDGTLDTELYVEPALQPHKYYNLYSDTTAYFLTYNNLGFGKRMVSPSPFTGSTPDSYYWSDEMTIFSDDYANGYTYKSYTRLTQFDIGEGFTSSRIREVVDPVFDVTLNDLDLPVITAPSPELELLMVGRNDTVHTVEILVGPDLPGLVSLGTYTIDNFNNKKVNETIPWSSISGSGQMVVRLQVIADGGINSNVSLSYVKLRYARGTDHDSQDYREYNLQVKGSGGNVVEILGTQPEACISEL